MQEEDGKIPWIPPDVNESPKWPIKTYKDGLGEPKLGLLLIYFDSVTAVLLLTLTSLLQVLIIFRCFFVVLLEK